MPQREQLSNSNIIKELSLRKALKNSLSEVLSKLEELITRSDYAVNVENSRIFESSEDKKILSEAIDGLLSKQENNKSVTVTISSGKIKLSSGKVSVTTEKELLSLD